MLTPSIVQKLYSRFTGSWALLQLPFFYLSIIYFFPYGGKMDAVSPSSHQFLGRNKGEEQKAKDEEELAR